MNQWILDTHDQFIDQRFGGWSAAARANVTADLKGTQDNLLVWFNNKAPHALPSYLNSIHNAVLRDNVKSKGGDPSKVGISTYTHPMAVDSDGLTKTTM